MNQRKGTALTSRRRRQKSIADSVHEFDTHNDRLYERATTAERQAKQLAAACAALGQVIDALELEVDRLREEIKLITHGIPEE